MKVKEAMDKIDELKRLSKNLRLLNQHFLNIPAAESEAIAEKLGISSPITKVLDDSFKELEVLAKIATEKLYEVNVNDSLDFLERD